MLFRVETIIIFNPIQRVCMVSFYSFEQYREGLCLWVVVVCNGESSSQRAVMLVRASPHSVLVAVGGMAVGGWR